MTNIVILIVRGTGVSPNLPCCCLYGASGWASVAAFFRKACKGPVCKAKGTRNTWKALYAYREQRLDESRDEPPALTKSFPLDLDNTNTCLVRSK